MPEISVIIPTYGSPDGLEQAISSVLQQTFVNFELIVVDDNNPQTIYRKETESIMDKIMELDKRVKYVKHISNKNGSAARNTGIKLSQGKYISFLDSDDEYTPERLEKCKNALENINYSNYAAVYTGCEYRKNNQHYRVMSNVKSGNFFLDYLKLRFNLYTGSNIFITKSAVSALQGFDESFVRHQDMEFMIRFFKKYDIIGIPEVLVIKNFVGKNRPSAQKMEEIKTHFFNVFQNDINLLTVKDKEQIYSAHYRQLSENFLLECNYNRALFYYNKVRTNHCLSMRLIVRALTYMTRGIINKIKR